MWSLKFLSGPKAGQEILLQEGLFVLGREESCEISVPSAGISKKHAQISLKENRLFIEDLNSSNGTFFEGKQIKKKRLQSGDRVILYNVIFEVER
ncbi:MAG: FHA domain-containing protein, partial [Oligoflexia bacterium]|nr:FHA domain-containing protein [Oligoflexia bacterium]